MSAFTDRPHSTEEENRNTSLTGSPLGQVYYAQFRQLSWASTGLNRPTGHTSQLAASDRSDLTSPRPSFEDRSSDLRLPLRVRDAYPFPSSAPADVNAFAYNWNRTVSDPVLPFGTRPEAEDTRVVSGEIHMMDDRGREDYTSGGANPGFPRFSRTRPPYRQDEFDGPHQFLPLPLPQQDQSRGRPLLELPVSLSPQEQDNVARRTNDCLSQCAFHFVAKYQFPIPIERDKPAVRQASDREWTEWAYLLKRLATKRRIPARVLWDGQIRQLVTTLENSIAVRPAVNVRPDAPMARLHRDDRYMLQLISSGLQVAKILKDAVAMEQLNQLYVQTETLILDRRSGLSLSPPGSVGSGRIIRGALGPVSRVIGSGIGIGGGSGGSGGSGDSTGY